MVFGRTAFSILQGAKAHNGFQHRLIAHSSRSRIYSPTIASRDSTRLALRRPFASHSFDGVENSGKDEGDVAASEEEANEGVELLASGGPKVQKTFLLPSPRHGGLNLTDLKAEVAKILGSYDLAEECSFYSYENQFNYFLATLTEDQLELIKKSLEVISVMEDGDIGPHRIT